MSLLAYGAAAFLIVMYLLAERTEACRQWNIIGCFFVCQRTIISVSVISCFVSSTTRAAATRSAS